MNAVLIAMMACACFFACAGLSPSAFANVEPELTLREALNQAQLYSPRLKAAGARETEAGSEVGIAKADYYPSLEAQAIDSSGFPGSTSYLGIGGLMGSPFRSGLGAGVVFTQTLYDFGRTANRTQAAEHQLERQRQDTELTRTQIDQEVIEAYFSCALNRSQKESWVGLLSDADVVAREVNRFVQTGQRSVVDRYLAETQKQEAVTAVADYETRETQSQKRLAVILGRTTPPHCPCLPENDGFGLETPQAKNPFIARAEADLKSVESQLGEAKSQNLPTLVGMGSAGYLQDQRLVGHTDYSLGIGISIPIFEGFRIKDEVERASAEVNEKEYSLQASQLFLADYNQRYDETLFSTATRLEHLRSELKLAQEAFELAKKRYFSFQGDLLDVRAALTNLTRVLLDVNTTRAQYLQSKELKEVLNGAR